MFWNALLKSGCWKCTGRLGYMKRLVLTGLNIPVLCMAMVSLLETFTPSKFSNVFCLGTAQMKVNCQRVWSSHLHYLKGRSWMVYISRLAGCRLGQVWNLHPPSHPHFNHPIRKFILEVGRVPCHCTDHGLMRPWNCVWKKKRASMLELETIIWQLYNGNTCI